MRAANKRDKRDYFMPVPRLNVSTPAGSAADNVGARLLLEAGEARSQHLDNLLLDLLGVLTINP